MLDLPAWCKAGLCSGKGGVDAHASSRLLPAVNACALQYKERVI